MRQKSLVEYAMREKVSCDVAKNMLVVISVKFDGSSCVLCRFAASEW